MSRRYSKSSKSGGSVKARAKINRKMSKDGLIERNAVTGEDIIVSKREADADLKSGRRSSEPFLQLDKRGNVPREPDETAHSKKKQKNRRIAEHSDKIEIQNGQGESASIKPQVCRHRLAFGIILFHTRHISLSILPNTMPMTSPFDSA